MARFIGKVQGSRGIGSRVGHKSKGLRSTCQGHNSGVIVRAKCINDVDVFEIFETKGSSDTIGILIKTIYGEKHSSS